MICKQFIINNAVNCYIYNCFLTDEGMILLKDFVRISMIKIYFVVFKNNNNFCR